MASYQTLGGTRRQPPAAPLTPAQQDELRRKAIRAEDIAIARGQGHSDDDIAAAIAARYPEVKAALDRGYPASEVLGASVAVHGLGTQDLNVHHTNRNTDLIEQGSRGRAVKANEAANPVSGGAQRAADFKAGGGLLDATTVKTGNPTADTLLKYTNPAAIPAQIADTVGGVINMFNAPAVRQYRRGGGTESGAANLNSALNLFESFIPVEGAAAGASAAARGAQAVGRRAVGAVANRGTARAAGLVRKSLGPDLERAVAALQAAPEGVSATQVLADAGIDADTFMALGKIVGDSPLGAQGTRQLAEGQAADRASTMSRVAGGDTTTNAMLAADAGRQNVNALSGPMRNEAIGLSNVGQVIPRLENIARASEAKAAAKVGDVRKFAPFGERLATDAQVLASTPEMDQTALNQLRSLAGLAEKRVSQSAGESLSAGDVARNARERIADLNAQGITALDTNRLTSQLRSMAGGVETRANDPMKNTLLKIADKIDELAARNGGVIDAADLYEVRKSAVSDVAHGLLDATDPSNQSKRVAGILGQITPKIDEALKAAGGGDKWADYFATHASGMREIERQQLGAVAADLLRDNPKKFVKLVRGNAPKVVRDTVGGGTYDIREALAPDNLPSRLPAMQDVARQLERDKRVADLAKSGKTAAEELLRKEGTITEKVLRRLVVHGNPKLAAADALASMLIDMRLAPQVQAALVEGFRSGKSAAELLVGVPARDRSRLASALADPKFWTPVLRGGVTGGAASNAMAPDNRNAMAR